MSLWKSVGLVTLFLALAFIPAIEVDDTWSAAHTRGFPGTFTADHESCQRTYCSWRGYFTSSDGVMVAKKVSYKGPLNADRTAEAVARTRASDEVYPAGSWWPFLRDVAFLIFCGSLVLFFGGFAYFRLKHGCEPVLSPEELRALPPRKRRRRDARD